MTQDVQIRNVSHLHKLSPGSALPRLLVLGHRRWPIAKRLLVDWRGHRLGHAREAKGAPCFRVHKHRQSWLLFEGLAAGGRPVRLDGVGGNVSAMVRMNIDHSHVSHPVGWGGRRFRAKSGQVALRVLSWLLSVQGLLQHFRLHRGVAVSAWWPHGTAMVGYNVIGDIEGESGVGCSHTHPPLVKQVGVTVQTFISDQGKVFATHVLIWLHVPSLQNGAWAGWYWAWGWHTGEPVPGDGGIAWHTHGPAPAIGNPGRRGRHGVGHRGGGRRAGHRMRRVCGRSGAGSTWAISACISNVPLHLERKGRTYKI